MPLILAIEPDKRQSSQLAAVVKGLHAELVHRASATDALTALQGRVPDLVLTTSLISPKDDAMLATRLRELGPAAAHVQTVTIPLLGTAAAAPARPKSGMLAALRREKPQQAPVTDGCSPEVFADQVRQYLATAEEQKVNASTRLAAAAAEAVPEPRVVVDDFLTPAEPEQVPEPEPEPMVEAAAEPVAESISEPEEPEEFAVDEPAGPPLSQLLQLVSAPAPAAAAPVVDESIFFDAPLVEAATEPIVEVATDPEAAPEPIAEPVPARAPAIAAEWQSEEGWEHAPEPELQPELDPQPAPNAAGDFGDLYVDPMAAQALDELSHQIVTPSVADGIPGEPPVPVVEMRGFQSLDSIASELAAGPSQPSESLEDLASLFAAKPAPVRAATPTDVPRIDPGLFASAPAAPPTAFEAPEPEPIVSFEPDVFEPAIQEPGPEPEPVAVAASPDLDEEISLDVDAFTFAPPEPAAPAEPSRFSFTFVDGFGDALSDFDVPNAASMAAELGLGEYLPGDSYAATPRAAAPAPPEAAGKTDAAPALDDEALSLIGDAARKVSLDAFVVDEFERGVAAADGRGKKAKKRAHAGATRATPTPAPERPAATPAKRPVQDEWGMFDPEQCGFAALEDEDAAEERPTTGTRVRVISY